MNVLLIAGGWSGEREVSLAGAKGIGEALAGLGHTVVPFDPLTDFSRLAEEAKRCSFAFINLHGAPGEDGLLQVMLERLGLPYQGSGPAASQLALNKAAAKFIFQSRGLPTADFEFLPRHPAPDYLPALPLPLVVKPNRGGSSLGLSIVRKPEQFAPALDKVYALGDEALVEAYLPGQEITVGVLGDDPLPPILIQPAVNAEFFDYHSKYTPNAAKEICPAPIPAELTASLQLMALEAHAALGLRGYSRTDFMVGPDGARILEINTLPGMTPTSLIPQAAAASGMPFPKLIARLIELGIEAAGQGDEPPVKVAEMLHARMRFRDLGREVTPEEILFLAAAREEKGQD